MSKEVDKSQSRQNNEDYNRISPEKPNGRKLTNYLKTHTNNNQQDSKTLMLSKKHSDDSNQYSRNPKAIQKTESFEPRSLGGSASVLNYNKTRTVGGLGLGVANRRIN